MSMSILLAVGVSLIDIQVFHFIWTQLLNYLCHHLLFVLCPRTANYSSFLPVSLTIK